MIQPTSLNLDVSDQLHPTSVQLYETIPSHHRSVGTEEKGTYDYAVLQREPITIPEITTHPDSIDYENEVVHYNKLEVNAGEIKTESNPAYH